MMTLAILLYLGVALVAWYVIAGWIYSDFRALWRGHPDLARKHLREDHGTSLVLGGLFAVLWPLGLPVAWAITGYAQHGCWKDAV